MRWRTMLLSISSKLYFGMTTSDICGGLVVFRSLMLESCGRTAQNKMKCNCISVIVSAWSRAVGV